MKRLTPSLRWLYGLTLVFIGFSFFWGFCWNWWAQSNLWQFLFQDYCPGASEEARYPANTDVLVSARADPYGARSLPDNRWMFYLTRAVNGRNPAAFTYDFQSGTTAPFAIQQTESGEPGVFITNNWLLVVDVSRWRSSRPATTVDYLWHRETNQQIPLTSHRIVEELQDAPPELVRLLRASSSVYVTGFGTEHIIVALPSTIEQSVPESGNLILYSGVNGDINETANALQESGISAIVIGSTLSEDGQFYFSQSEKLSIFSSATHQPIVENELDNYRFVPTGWAYRDRGTILTSRVPNYLIGGISLSVLSPRLFPIPDPILLLRQNAQYLPPDLQAEFAARDTEEARNKQWAGVVLAVLLAGTVAVGASTMRAHWRRARMETEVQYAEA